MNVYRIVKLRKRNRIKIKGNQASILNTSILSDQLTRIMLVENSRCFKGSFAQFLTFKYKDYATKIPNID